MHDYGSEPDNINSQAYMAPRVLRLVDKVHKQFVHRLELLLLKVSLVFGVEVFVHKTTVSSPGVAITHHSREPIEFDAISHGPDQ